MQLYQKPQFLSERDMQRIHEASVYLLKTKGVVFKSQKAVEILKKKGAAADGGKVFFTEELIEECLKLVPSSFCVEAINSSRTVVVGGELLIHPAGGRSFFKKGR